MEEQAQKQMTVYLLRGVDPEWIGDIDREDMLDEALMTGAPFSNLEWAQQQAQIWHNEEMDVENEELVWVQGEENEWNSTNTQMHWRIIARTMAL